jgi:hypothetical protein
MKSITFMIKTVVLSYKYPGEGTDRMLNTPGTEAADDPV